MTSRLEILRKAYNGNGPTEKHHDLIRRLMVKMSEKSPTYHEIPKQLDPEKMADVRDEVLAELTDTPQSVREIADAAGHSYSRTRHAIDALVKKGKAVKTYKLRNVFFMRGK